MTRTTRVLNEEAETREGPEKTAENIGEISSHPGMSLLTPRPDHCDAENGSPAIINVFPFLRC